MSGADGRRGSRCMRWGVPTLHSSYFEGLRGARGLDLLRIALPSTLPFRAQSDNPDAIVIVTDESFQQRGGITAPWKKSSLTLLRFY
jgi:hypothetical protein